MTWLSNLHGTLNVFSYFKEMVKKYETKKMSYKIFRKENGRLYSYFAVGEARVEYQRNGYGETSKHLFEMGYGVTAFDTLQNLYTFLVNTSFFPPKGSYSMKTGKHSPFLYEIWEVEGEDEMPVPPYQLILGYLPLYKESIASFPDGTQMFKKVKLIKKIRKRCV